MNEETSVIVIDVGGGTTDLTLLEIRRHQKRLEFEVRASTGRRVGGEHVTSKVAKEIMDMIEEQLLADKDFIKNKCVFPRDNPAFMFDVYQEAEQAKVALASRRMFKYAVRLGFDCIGRDGKGFVFTKRVHVTAAQVERAFGVLLTSISDAYGELQKVINGDLHREINKHLLVGGSGMAQLVIKYVTEMIGDQSVDAPVSSSRCVADGAAMFHMCTRKKTDVEFVLIDSVPKGLGIVTFNLHSISPAQGIRPLRRSTLLGARRR